MVANRHAFTIPAELDLSQIKICVAGGDGGEVEIYKDGKFFWPTTNHSPLRTQ